MKRPHTIPTISDVAHIVAEYLVELAEQGAPRARCIEEAAKLAAPYEALIAAEPPTKSIH